MGLMKYIAAAVVLGAATSLLRPASENSDAIYQSLETLAEIMTVAEKASPSPVSGEDLVEGAIDGLLEQLDPHSNFYNRDQYRTMKEDQKGAFYGIGIIVGYQNDRLTVIAPLAGTPAGEAGVRAGDVIHKIDGNLTEGMDVYEGIRMLRGEEGTEVVVTILRQNVEEPLEFSLHRAEIPTNNVRASFMVDEATGYVALKDFGEMATTELENAIGELVLKGMKQLILDLRGNPGGLLPQAIGVVSLFIPGGKLVVSTQGRLQNASQEYYSEKTSSVPQTPLIVLIDRGSASASEIVAGAIQDHDRGLIVGVNSWGKGLVQSVFPLAKQTKGLALTTSRYFTPSGRNIQGNYDSLESYYNPVSSEDLYFGTKAISSDAVFKTTNGRDVLEVRGITPDVYIAFPEVPPLVQKLEAKYLVFFDFATRHQEEYGPIDRDWQADDRVLSAFEHHLTESDIPHGAFEEHRELIRQKLTYEFLNIADTHWSWRYWMLRDHHVKAALGLFGQARELLMIYRGETTLRSEYAQELKQFARLHQPKGSEN